MTQKCFSLVTGALMAAVLLMAGCSNPLDQQEQNSAVSGKGTVRLSLAGAKGRTLFPAIGLSYKVEAEKDGTAETIREDWDGSDLLSFSLETGTWTIKVTGYVTEDTSPVPVMASYGEGNVTIDEGDPQSVTITLVRQGNTDSGTGTLRYGGLDFTNLALTSGTLTVARVDGAELETKDLLDSGYNPTSAVSRSAGYHILTVELKRTDDKEAVKSELVHIYEGRTTSVIESEVMVFGDADFALPRLTGTVTIGGNPAVGETVTANITSLNGTGTPSYQWNRRDTQTGTDIPITGATGPDYLLSGADNGKYITVTVSRDGYSGSQTSVPVGPVGLPPLTGTVTIVESGPPSGGVWASDQAAFNAALSGSDNPILITGSVNTGGAGSSSKTIIIGRSGTLTADTSLLPGSGTISYQWKRGDSSDAVNNNIGTDSQTYELSAADHNKYISVTVSRAGYSTSVNSTNTVGPVQVISGTLTVETDFSVLGPGSIQVRSGGSIEILGSKNVIVGTGTQLSFGNNSEIVFPPGKYQSTVSGKMVSFSFDSVAKTLTVGGDEGATFKIGDTGGTNTAWKHINFPIGYSLVIKENVGYGGSFGGASGYAGFDFGSLSDETDEAGIFASVKAINGDAWITGVSDGVELTTTASNGALGDFGNLYCAVGKALIFPVSASGRYPLTVNSTRYSISPGNGGGVKIEVTGSPGNTLNLASNAIMAKNGNTISSINIERIGGSAGTLSFIVLSTSGTQRLLMYGHTTNLNGTSNDPVGRIVLPGSMPGGLDVGSATNIGTIKTGNPEGGSSNYTFGSSTNIVPSNNPTLSPSSITGGEAILDLKGTNKMGSGYLVSITMISGGTGGLMLYKNIGVTSDVVIDSTTVVTGSP